MSKDGFTRRFGSLDEFAAQFGEAYVQSAKPAVERVHQASQPKVQQPQGVKAREQEALARKRVDELVDGLKPKQAKPRHGRAAVRSKRVSKVM